MDRRLSTATPSSLRERNRRDLIGAQFRLHGREPETGLDCVGVAAWVHGVAVPTGYRLRCSSAALVEDGLRALGFVAGDGAEGDVVVMLAGQIHLGVVTARGFVHADAGLGRVVESPWREDWAVLGFWRRGSLAGEPSPVGAPAPSPLPAGGDF